MRTRDIVRKNLVSSFEANQQLIILQDMRLIDAAEKKIWKKQMVNKNAFQVMSVLHDLKLETVNKARAFERLSAI